MAKINTFEEFLNEGRTSSSRTSANKTSVNKTSARKSNGILRIDRVPITNMPDEELARKKRTVHILFPDMTFNTGKMARDLGLNPYDDLSYYEASDNITSNYSGSWDTDTDLEAFGDTLEELLSNIINLYKQDEYIKKLGGITIKM